MFMSWASCNLVFEIGSQLLRLILSLLAIIYHWSTIIDKSIAQYTSHFHFNFDKDGCGIITIIIHHPSLSPSRHLFFLRQYQSLSHITAMCHWSNLCHISSHCPNRTWWQGHIHFIWWGDSWEWDDFMLSWSEKIKSAL